MFRCRAKFVAAIIVQEHRCTRPLSRAGTAAMRRMFGQLKFICGKTPFRAYSWAERAPEARPVVGACGRLPRSASAATRRWLPSASLIRSRSSREEETMTKDSDIPVVVSLGTPLLTRATRAVFPAQTTVAECIRELSNAEPADAGERRVVQQIRRETQGVRFDILLILRGGRIDRARPDQRLAEIATPREVRTPTGTAKMLVAQIELQSYAPVGGRS